MYAFLFAPGIERCRLFEPSQGFRALIRTRQHSFLGVAEGEFPFDQRNLILQIRIQQIFFVRRRGDFPALERHFEDGLTLPIDVQIFVPHADEERRIGEDVLPPAILLSECLKCLAKVVPTDPALETHLIPPTIHHRCVV
jgi:hypothetical protein